MDFSSDIGVLPAQMTNFPVKVVPFSNYLCYFKVELINRHRIASWGLLRDSQLFNYSFVLIDWLIKSRLQSIYINLKLLVLVSHLILVFRVSFEDWVKPIYFGWQLHNFTLILNYFSIDVWKLFNSTFELFVFLLELRNSLLRGRQFTSPAVRNIVLHFTYLLSS